MLEAPPPDADLRVGRSIRAEGTVREPAPWQAGRLLTMGVHRLVSARAIETAPGRRGGLAGALDGVRDRAEAALERGAPPAEAALARGFVLGQDDRIDPATVDDFRRSGLAHLLAVSGQNVLLLALLAMPLLALLGVPLRARLIAIVALIAIYVPVTGAGASIQRAAVMGIAGIAAVLAGRPSHRAYVLLLAAALTLAVNPRAAADIGWQLSFAAVVGILLWARPIAGLVARDREAATPLRRGLADGVGITIAATLATAPISAAHFETVSLASLPANLLALPAVAPVMWLGMLAAALGQIPAIPVEPLNWLCSHLVAYIAQVAHWFGTPGWASVPVAAPSPAALAGIGAALVTAGALGARSLARRVRLRGSALPKLRIAAATAPIALAIAVPLPGGAPATAARPPGHLTVTVLDVGQGDAILLDPSPGDPVLVDAGPPGTDLPQELAARSVERLAAIVLTHDQSDHSGGLAAVLRTVPTDHVLHAGAGRATRAAAEATGAEADWLEAGDALRSGALRLRVVWPPAAPERRAPPGTDPNERSVVLHSRWHRFDALLTGDAEAEAAPLDPGPLDFLKVAHHGSEDAGLPALLERTDPRIAVISAGADNPYGHPHPSTLAALAEAGVPVARTDIDGDVELTVTRDGVTTTG
jgi:competence protein ComEC